MNIGTPARYIAMAASLLVECRLSWFGLKPSFSGPMEAAVSLMHINYSWPVNLCEVELSFRYVFIGVSG